MRRLAEFRAINTEDETVLNYFDELEIHPDHTGKYDNLDQRILSIYHHT